MPATEYAIGELGCICIKAGGLGARPDLCVWQKQGGSKCGAASFVPDLCPFLDQAYTPLVMVQAACSCGLWRQLQRPCKKRAFYHPQST